MLFTGMMLDMSATGLSATDAWVNPSGDDQSKHEEVRLNSEKRCRFAVVYRCAAQGRGFVQ
jgi:hypothetical protein